MNAFELILVVVICLSLITNERLLQPRLVLSSWAQFIFRPQPPEWHAPPLSTLSSFKRALARLDWHIVS
jgi:hypothetical protein